VSKFKTSSRLSIHDINIAIMPPRLNLFAAGRSLAIRSRPSIAARVPAPALRIASRGFADEKPKGPNQDVLGHVSEEAADLGEVTGETKPDLSQGTPVQEVGGSMCEAARYTDAM
jgi:small subunit ribosomal protein S7